MLKQRKEEKRLKEEQARLAAENGVSFDYEDVDGDNVNENENNEKKDGAVVKKKNDMSNKYVYKKDTPSKENKNNDDETTRELLLEKTLNTRNETIFGGKNFSKNSLQKEIWIE